MMLMTDRFHVYETSLKSLFDLFDWWERAVGMLASSFIADQQAELQDERTTKKAKKPAGLIHSDSLARDLTLSFIIISHMHRL